KSRSPFGRDTVHNPRPISSRSCFPVQPTYPAYNRNVSGDARLAIIFSNSAFPITTAKYGVDFVRINPRTPIITGPPAYTVIGFPFASGSTSPTGTLVALFSINPTAESESN